MKAPSTKVRFTEAEKLLDYGFNNFTFKELCKKDDVIGEVFVNKGVNSSIEAVLENDVGTLIKKGNDKEISQELNLQNNISAPVSKRTKIRRTYIFIKWRTNCNCKYCCKK